MRAILSRSLLLLLACTSADAFSVLKLRSQTTDAALYATSYNRHLIDPSRIEVTNEVDLNLEQISFSPSQTTANNNNNEQSSAGDLSPSVFFPFAAMLQGSAPYIADHSGKIAVLHIPASLLHNKQHCDSLLKDVGLCWLLGMKLVIVIGSCIDDSNDNNAEDGNSSNKTLRQVEEETGYLRTELERKLNPCLRAHAGASVSSTETGNVVSGNNFCIASRLLEEHDNNNNNAAHNSGLATDVHVSKIHQVLANNDVLLLSTIVLSLTGEDWVQTEGQQLAAKVATELRATKLIFLNEQPSVLTYRDGDNSDDAIKHIQDLPLSMAKNVLSSSSNEKKRRSQDDNKNENASNNSKELLKNLEWAAYAAEQNVHRAHIVNPVDGALLEELFTSQHGANTCIYHDNEHDEYDAETGRLLDDSWELGTTSLQQSHNVSVFD